MNQAPTIIQPEGGEKFVSLFADTPLVVVAADREGDALVFLWSTPLDPDLASTERADGELTTSTAVVPFDVLLDGEDVDCLVVDQSDDFNDSRVVFHLEIP